MEYRSEALLDNPVVTWQQLVLKSVFEFLTVDSAVLEFNTAVSPLVHMTHHDLRQSNGLPEMLTLKQLEHKQTVGKPAHNNAREKGRQRTHLNGCTQPHVTA